MRKKIEIEVMGLDEIKELTKQEISAEKAVLALAKGQMLAATAAERLAKATAQTAAVTQDANDKSAIAAARVATESAKAAAVVQNASNQTAAVTVKNNAVIATSNANTAKIGAQAQATLQIATAKTNVLNTQAANSTVQLGIAATNAATAQGRLALAQSKFNQSLTQGTSASQGFFASFLRYELLSRVFGEITKAASESVQAMIEIDKQAARTSRIMGSETKPYASALVREGGISTGRGFKDSGETLYQLGTFIKDTTTLTSAFREQMALLMATETDEREGTRLSIQLYEQFGEQMGKNKTEAEKFHGIIELEALAFKNAHAEVSEMAAAYKYLGSAAEITHIPLEQVNATLIALSTLGVRGRMAGTGAATFIVDLVKRFDELNQGVKGKDGLVWHFKIERDANGELNFIKTLHNIKEAYDKLNAIDKEKMLFDVGGGKVGIRTLGELLKGLDNLEKQAKESKDALNGMIDPLKDMKKEMDNTFQTQGLRAWNALLGEGASWIQNIAKHLGAIQSLKDMGDRGEFNASIATRAAQAALSLSTAKPADNDAMMIANFERVLPLMKDWEKKHGKFDSHGTPLSVPHAEVTLRNDSPFFMSPQEEQDRKDNAARYEYERKHQITDPEYWAQVNALKRDKAGGGKYGTGVYNSETVEAELAILKARRSANSPYYVAGEGDGVSPFSRFRVKSDPSVKGLSKEEQAKRAALAEKANDDIFAMKQETLTARGQWFTRDRNAAIKEFQKERTLYAGNPAALQTATDKFNARLYELNHRRNEEKANAAEKLADEKEKAKDKAVNERDDADTARERREDRTRQLQRKNWDFTASDYAKERADARDDFGDVLRDKSARPKDKVIAYQNYQNAINNANKKIGWSVLSGAMGSLHAQSQYANDIEQGEATERMDAYGGRIRGLDRGFRGNALGTSMGDELGLLGAKRDLASDALRQAQERHETENVAKFTEALEDAEKALTDFKDNLEKQKYQRRIEGIGDRANNSLFDLEMSQGVVGSSGAYGQSVASARARVGIYARQRDERARAYVFSPDGERESNRKLWEDSVKEFKRASKELADLPLRRFIEQKEQVQGVLTSGLVNFLRGKGSIGAGFAGAGDMIVNKVLENQINKWFDPVADAATKQILALDANTKALLAMPTQMQGAIAGTSGAGSAGMGIPALVAVGVTSAFGGANGDGKSGIPELSGRNTIGKSGIPELSGRKTIGKNAAGKYLAAYSVFNQGMEQGASVGGVISGAMAGAELGGVKGAIIGGLTNLIGGLFHHKKQDPLENRNNWNFGSQNAPDRFFYEAYRFKVTNKMPTAAQLGLTNTDYKPPVVNIYIDGKKAMDSQISKSINGANSSYSTQNFQNVP